MRSRLPYLTYGDARSPAPVCVIGAILYPDVRALGVATVAADDRITLLWALGGSVYHRQSGTLTARVFHEKHADELRWQRVRGCGTTSMPCEGSTAAFPVSIPGLDPRMRFRT